MKTIRYIVLIAVAILALVACLSSTTPDADTSAEPTADLPLTVQAAVDATLAAQPTDTPSPNLQATVEVAVLETLSAHATSSALPEPEVAIASDRPHRSYPAPTGAPGFRKYYQKRCYPGCHYGASAAEPTRVHP